MSTLKFAYLESNVKLQFVSHIMDKGGPKHVSQLDLDALGLLIYLPRFTLLNQTFADAFCFILHTVCIVEGERLKTKAELKERKLRAIELESMIRAEAELLDESEFCFPSPRFT